MAPRTRRTRDPRCLGRRPHPVSMARVPLNAPPHTSRHAASAGPAVAPRTPCRPHLATNPPPPATPLLPDRGRSPFPRCRDEGLVPIYKADSPWAVGHLAVPAAWSMATHDRQPWPRSGSARETPSSLPSPEERWRPTRPTLSRSRCAVPRLPRESCLPTPLHDLSRSAGLVRSFNLFQRHWTTTRRIMGLTARACALGLCIAVLTGAAAAQKSITESVAVLPDCAVSDGRDSTPVVDFKLTQNVFRSPVSMSSSEGRVATQLTPPVSAPTISGNPHPPPASPPPALSAKR
jgi:hypothetical protein